MKDILVVILSIVIITYIIFKNWKKLKELTKLQIFGVGITYLSVASLGGSFIYYGGNWIAGKIPNLILKYIVFVGVICMTLYVCIGVLNKLLRKITNGVFPTK